MSAFSCTNCGRETEENEHHVRLSYADRVLPGGCVRVVLDLYRSPDGWISESRVLGTAPQRTAARLVPGGQITM